MSDVDHAGPDAAKGDKQLGECGEGECRHEGDGSHHKQVEPSPLVEHAEV